MKIIIGSDHAGFTLKEALKQHLSSQDIIVEDVGTSSEESCDYPDFALQVARQVQEKGGFGILVCGTGIGMSITANKVKGIRAAVCFDEFTAKAAREHNDANVVCIGSRTTKTDIAKNIVDAFLHTSASPEQRHHKRVDKITTAEKDTFK